jgi:hypothetical protein
MLNLFQQPTLPTLVTRSQRGREGVQIDVLAALQLEALRVAESEPAVHCPIDLVDVPADRRISIAITRRAVTGLHDTLPFGIIPRREAP